MTAVISDRLTTMGTKKEIIESGSCDGLAKPFNCVSLGEAQEFRWTRLSWCVCIPFDKLTKIHMMQGQNQVGRSSWRSKRWRRGCEGRKELVLMVVWGGHEPLESTDDSPLSSHAQMIKEMIVR